MFLLNLPAILAGCYGRGSLFFPDTSKVVHKAEVQKVTRVYLLPIDYSIDFHGKGQKDTPTSNDSATFQLWKELESRHLFELIPLDAVRKALDSTRSSDSLNYTSIARLVKADAFINPKLTYFWDKQWDMPAAYLLLGLVLPPDGKVIALGSHTTLNNYYLFRSEDINQVRIDATQGAVDALVKAVQEAREP